MSGDDLARLRADARLTATPCGDGTMSWRIWGSGPAVVLLHGGHGSWTHWVRNIASLSAHATVVVPDLPGHGDSALPAEPGAGPSHVLALSEGLRRILGPGEGYTLAGFSLGATIGARLSAHDAGLVRSLALISLGGFGERAQLRLESVRRAPDEAARNAAHRRNLEILMVADPRMIDDTVVHLQRENIERARVEPRDLAWPISTPAAVRAAPCPVTVIYGERDATVLPSVASWADAVVACRPDAQVRIIPGAGHWVQFEAPGPVEAAILGVAPTD